MEKLLRLHEKKKIIMLILDKDKSVLANFTGH